MQSFQKNKRKSPASTSLDGWASSSPFAQDLECEKHARVQTRTKRIHKSKRCKLIPFEGGARMNLHILERKHRKSYSSCGNLSIRIHIRNFTYPKNVLQVFLERCWPTSQCQLFRCWAWWSESEWPLDDQSALAREMFLAKHRISVKGNKMKQVHWPSHSIKVRCAYDQHVCIICPVYLGISWDAAAWSWGHGDGLPD